MHLPSLSRTKEPAGDATRAGPPGPVASLLAVAGLWAFAVSQPLLALLGDDPAFFVVRNAGPAAIATFAVALTFGPPLVAWLLGLGAGRLDRRLGAAVHLLTIALLAGAAIAPLARRAGVGSTAACVALGLVAAGAFTWTYRRHHLVAVWTRSTAILPVLSLVAFLLLSPTSELIDDRPTGTPRADGSDLPSVAVLVLDELPTQSLLDADGDIDAERFPNLARLSRDATWYRNSTTVANGTEQAVPAILSGREPTATEPLAANHPDTLFTLLAPTHHLTVSESFTALCGSSCDPPGDPVGLDQQLRALASDSAGVWRDRLTGTTEAEALDDFAEAVEVPDDLPAAMRELYGAPARFTEFLDAVRPSPDPSLWFLHLVLPHQPWRLYPDGSAYAAAPDFASLDEGWWVASVLQQRHLYQAMYADALVGELLDHLREVGEYDDTAIVVASDHGVAFDPGRPQRLWSPDTVDSIAYAPLFIKAPGQTTGGPDDRNLMTIDIVPTVAAQLGIDVPWQTAGVAADDPRIAERGGGKWMYDFGPIGQPTEGTRYEFEMASTTPRAGDRWVGQREPGSPRLSALLAPLGVADWVGAPLADIANDIATSEVMLDRPVAELGPDGFVQGRVIDAPADGRVLVALDGRVVTASPLITLGGEPGHFLAMLPPGAAADDALDRIEVAIATGNDATGGSTVTLARLS